MSDKKGLAYLSMHIPDTVHVKHSISTTRNAGERNNILVLFYQFQGSIWFISNKKCTKFILFYKS
jgi:hypothetical protein